MGARDREAGGRPDIHSVVAAASRQAKQYGSRSGMTTWEAAKLCPHVVFVPGDPDKYETVTRRFVEILIRYTPMVEVYSIDEVFLDVTQESPRHGGPLALARMIQDEFRREPGKWITCSVGIAPNKMLAKLVVEKAKPGGVAWIVPEEIPAVRAETPVGAVAGIGPRIAKRLELMGLRTLADLSRYPVARLKHAFGVYGTVLSLWGQGLDPNPLLPYWEEEEVESVGHSHAIPRALRHPDEARSVLLYLCDRTARRLGVKGVVGRVVHFELRDSEMRYRGAQRALGVPTDDEDRIFRAALDLIEDQGGSRTKRRSWG